MTNHTRDEAPALSVAAVIEEMRTEYYRLCEMACSSDVSLEQLQCMGVPGIKVRNWANRLEAALLSVERQQPSETKEQP